MPLSPDIDQRCGHKRLALRILVNDHIWLLLVVHHVHQRHQEAPLLILGTGRPKGVGLNLQ